MSDYPVLSGIALTGFGGRPRVDDELAKAIREETTRLLASCARKDAALRMLLDYCGQCRRGDPCSDPRCQIVLVTLGLPTRYAKPELRAALAEAAPAAGEHDHDNPFGCAKCMEETLRDVAKIRSRCVGCGAAVYTSNSRCRNCAMREPPAAPEPERP